MNDDPTPDDSPMNLAFNRPDWPWWVVMGKAFVTLFIVGTWGMILMWMLLIGAWFSPVPSSFGVALKVVLSCLLNILPIWVLWAFSVSVWSERRTFPLKAGLVLGALFSAFMVMKAVQWAMQQESSATAFNLEVKLPFCLLTFFCVAYELWKQFRRKHTRS